MIVRARVVVWVLIPRQPNEIGCVDSEWVFVAFHLFRSIFFLLSFDDMSCIILTDDSIKPKASAYIFGGFSHTLLWKRIHACVMHFTHFVTKAPIFFRISLSIPHPNISVVDCEHRKTVQLLC